MRYKFGKYKAILQCQDVSNFIFSLTYRPAKIGEVTFNLKCEIERMERCLNLAVTAKCFQVDAIVTYIGRKGEKITLDERKENTIDCRSVNIEKKIYL